MISYTVEGNNLIVKLAMVLPLDSEEMERVINDVASIFPYGDISAVQELKETYRAEREKWLETEKAAPKVNFDISNLDAAVSKADLLIAKLKEIKALQG